MPLRVAAQSRNPQPPDPMTTTPHTTPPAQGATPRTDAATDFTSPEKLHKLARTLERELAAANEREKALRGKLQQMLDVAENADETGYVTDVGFVDLDKLHDEVRAILKEQPDKP